MPARRSPSADRSRTTAAAPSLGEHSMNRVSGGQIIREARTSSAVTALGNMASGLATPCRRFLTTTWARWSLGEAGVGQQPLGPEGEEGRCRAETGRLLPRGEERGPDDPLGHLLDPEDQHPVVLARGDRCRPQLEGGPPRGTAGLHVVDGDAGAGQRGEDPVPGGHAAVGRPAEGRLHVADADAGLGQRRPHRRHPHGRPGQVAEAAEGVEAHPGDPYLAHGWNTQVTEGSPSGPGTSSPSSCTGMPRARPSPSEAGHHPEQRVPVELDDAQPVGDRSGVAGGGDGHRGVEPDRPACGAGRGARRRRPR